MANIKDIEDLQKKLEVSLTQKMTEFEERLKGASASNVPTLAQLWGEFSNFKGIVSSMFKLMQCQIQECFTDMDKINMFKRRKALLFYGIPEHKEKEHQLVMSLLKERIGLSNIDSLLIKQCFRLGSSDNNSPRPILVFFSNHETKSNIWKLKSKLKGSSVSIGEFLTKTRQSIYNDARRHFGIKNVWTLDGTIYIKSTDGRVKVTKRMELDGLISKFPVESLISPGKSVNNQASCTFKVSSIAESEKTRRQQASSVSHDEESKRSRRLARK